MASPASASLGSWWYWSWGWASSARSRSRPGRRNDRPRRRATRWDQASPAASPGAAADAPRTRRRPRGAPVADGAEGLEPDHRAPGRQAARPDAAQGRAPSDPAPHLRGAAGATVGAGQSPPQARAYRGAAVRRANRRGAVGAEARPGARDRQPDQDDDRDRRRGPLQAKRSGVDHVRGDPLHRLGRGAAPAGQASAAGAAAVGAAAADGP